MERSAIIVEDDSNTALALTKAIKSLGFSVRVASTLQEARNLYQHDRPDLVLLDVSLPDGDGLDLMRDAAADDDTQFVVVTGNLGQDVAVRSLRAKASDFLLKPISLADLRNAVSSSFQPAGVDDAGTAQGVKPGVLSDTLLTTTSHDVHHRSSLLLAGNSPALRELEQTIKHLAGSQANVVISGEPGVDKISAAYALHCANNSAGAIFHVQCATGHVLMGDKQITDGFSECLEMCFGSSSGQHNVTLILDDIDLLNESRQRELLGYLTPRGLLNGQAGNSSRCPRLVSIQRRPGLSGVNGSVNELPVTS